MGYHYARLPGDAVPNPNQQQYASPAPSYQFDNEIMSAKHLPQLEKTKAGYFRGSPEMYLRNPVADMHYWNRPGNITEMSPCQLKTRNMFIAAVAILILFFTMLLFSK